MVGPEDRVVVAAGKHYSRLSKSVKNENAIIMKLGWKELSMLLMESIEANLSSVRVTCNDREFALLLKVAYPTVEINALNERRDFRN